MPARSCRTGGGVEHECAVDESVQMLIDKVHSSMEVGIGVWAGILAPVGCVFVRCLLPR